MDLTNLRSNWNTEIESDQRRGVPMPPFQKAAEGELFDLPVVDFDAFRGTDLVDALLNRRSERQYGEEPLTLHELAWLLFATQGVQRELGRGSLRPTPSAGARHPFESYVAAFAVDGLEPGLYRYLPYGHRMEVRARGDDLRIAAEAAINGQGWGAPAIFFWTAVPYRTHWRYPGRAAKLIAVDAGHLSQNLYLACAAIGCGTCAIGAYDQEKADRFLGVDSTSELMVYAAPVGRLPAKPE